MGGHLSALQALNQGGGVTPLWRTNAGGTPCTKNPTKALENHMLKYAKWEEDIYDFHCTVVIVKVLPPSAHRKYKENNANRKSPFHAFPARWLPIYIFSLTQRL